MQLSIRLALILIFSSLLVYTSCGNRVDSLIKQLTNDDPRVRANAAKSLGEIKDPRAVDPLISSLKDRDFIVNVRAVEALGKIRDRRAVEPLVYELDDISQGVGVQISAKEALIEIGKQDIEPIINALRLDIGRKEIIDVLVEIGKATPGSLIKALGNENASIRSAAAGALDKLGWEPKDDSEKAMFFIAKGELNKCVEIGQAAVEPLINALKMDGGWFRLFRGRVVQTLGKIGDSRAVEPLVNILREKNYGEGDRTYAAEALGKIGDSRAVEPLVNALSDEFIAIRANAAAALNQLNWQAKGDTEKAMFFIAKGELNKCVEIGQPAVEPLISALKFNERWINNRAAEALGKIGDSRAVEPLVNVLKFGNRYRILSGAVNALVKIGDSRAVEPLVNILIEKNYGEGDRTDAAEALGKLGKPGVEALTNALKDKDELLRNIVLIGLIRGGHISAVKLLISTLWSKDGYIILRNVKQLFNFFPISSDENYKINNGIIIMNREKPINLPELKRAENIEELETIILINYEAYSAGVYVEKSDNFPLLSKMGVELPASGIGEISGSATKYEADVRIVDWINKKCIAQKTFFGGGRPPAEIDTRFGVADWSGPHPSSEEIMKWLKEYY